MKEYETHIQFQGNKMMRRRLDKTIKTKCLPRFIFLIEFIRIYPSILLLPSKPVYIVKQQRITKRGRNITCLNKNTEEAATLQFMQKNIYIKAPFAEA